MSRCAPEPTAYFPAGGHLFYFWKGRVALYALLESLGVGPGDEVVVPGFTCVVIANAVLYLGAEPVYADIEPATYNASAETIEPLIGPRTRAILVQNSFGLSPDLDPIMRLAADRNLVVIEDCAHGLGGSYRGKANGTVAHASFFSLQWSKPITTGLGGIAYTADPELAQRMADWVARAGRPSVAEEAMLLAQRAAWPLTKQRWLFYPAVETYRWLTQRLGLSVGSATGGEIRSTAIPPNYAKKMGRLQRRSWERQLPGLPELVKRRRARAAELDAFFADRPDLDIRPPFRPDYAEHAMLRYAIRVADNPTILARARALRVPLGDWFQSPLHPVEGDLSPWKYRRGQCPVAEAACEDVVNVLPDRLSSSGRLERLFA